MRPTPSRIVLFFFMARRQPDSEELELRHRPAIVTSTSHSADAPGNLVVNLTVFWESGDYVNAIELPRDENVQAHHHVRPDGGLGEMGMIEGSTPPKPGTWAWPPRV